MSYLPGDDIRSALLDSAEYAGLCTASVRRVVDFVNSTAFETSITRAAFTTIPRWRYTREMNANPEEAQEGDDSDANHFEFVSVQKNLRGVARAQKGLLEETRRILHSKDDLVLFAVVLMELSV